MKKFFTTLGCAIALTAFALPANAEDYTFGQSVTFGDGVTSCTFNSGDGGYLTILTNVKEDISSDLEFSRDIGFGSPVIYDLIKVNRPDGYGYQVWGFGAAMDFGKNLSNFELKYSGTNSVTITFHNGLLENGGDSSIFDNPSTSGKIEVGVPFLVSPEHATWTITPKENIEPYCFVSNSDINIKSKLKATQKVGNFNMNLVIFGAGDLNSDGNYVYPSTNDWTYIPTNQITITYSGEDPVVLILENTNYVSENALEMTLDNTITLGESVHFVKGAFDYQEGAYEDLSLVYLLTDKNTNLLEEGQLKVLADGYDVTQDWEAVYIEEDGVYGYNGSVTDGYTYTFQYTGDAAVKFTLKSGNLTVNGEPTYMEDLAAVVAPAGPYAVNLTEMLLTWFGQEISVANPDYTIVLYKGQQQQMAGLLEWSLTSLNAAGSGNDEGVDPLADAAYDALLIKFEGIAPDTYTIKLPAGLVQNADGELNQAQTIEISVLPAAEYTVNPEPNKEYESLEKVTITFQGTVSENEYYEGEAGITVNGKNASVSVGGETVTLNINAVGAEASGQWDIVIPEGFFVINDGEALNPEINLAYFVSGPEPVEETSIDPANGIFPENSDVTITITYPGTKIELGTETTPLEVYDSNEYNEAYGYDDDVISINGMNVVIKLGELAKGTYNMTFREGAVLIDGAPNAGIDYTIMVDNTLGVTIIDNATGEKVIYNLQGVRVANPQKGRIYIINGKKTILR